MASVLHRFELDFLTLNHAHYVHSNVNLVSLPFYFRPSSCECRRPECDCLRARLRWSGNFASLSGSKPLSDYRLDSKFKSLFQALITGRGSGLENCWHIWKKHSPLVASFEDGVSYFYGSQVSNPVSLRHHILSVLLLPNAWVRRKDKYIFIGAFPEKIGWFQRKNSKMPCTFLVVIIHNLPSYLSIGSSYPITNHHAIDKLIKIE